MQKFLKKSFESRGIRLDQWFSKLFVRSQQICRGFTLDTSVAIWKSRICMVAIQEVLGTVLESCWISHAEGLIWDSVRQGWRDSCEVLGNCLYKECTTLVHQKVKEKEKMYQHGVYFFYRGLVYHYSWLFLITANASAGCAFGDGMWLAQRKSGHKEFYQGHSETGHLQDVFIFLLFVFSK